MINYENLEGSTKIKDAPSIINSNNALIDNALDKLNTGKVSKNQGIENKGKVLQVGDDGNVTPSDSVSVAITNVANDKYDKTGGYLSGNIVFDTNADSIIKNKDDSHLITLTAGNGTDGKPKGAKLTLEGEHHSDVSGGSFWLAAEKGDEKSELEGHPDGNLRWNGIGVVPKIAVVYNASTYLTQGVDNTRAMSIPSDRTKHLAYYIERCWPTEHWNNGAVVAINDIKSEQQLVAFSTNSSQAYDLRVVEVYI